VHSPPASSRIGQQLGRITLLIGSWTAMAECTDVETIRDRPANGQCGQRYRDHGCRVLGKICAETRFVMLVCYCSFSPGFVSVHLSLILIFLLLILLFFFFFFSLHDGVITCACASCLPFSKAQTECEMHAVALIHVLP
jgi:hypothetical protein